MSYCSAPDHRYVLNEHLEGCSRESRPHACVACKKCAFHWVQLVFDVLEVRRAG